MPYIWHFKFYKEIENMFWSLKTTTINLNTFFSQHLFECNANDAYAMMQMQITH